MPSLKTIADVLIPAIGTKIARLEVAAFAVACILAWVRPQTGSRLFCEMERRFRRLAKRRGLSVLTVAALALLLRAALLPVAPPAVPGLPDEFSSLLPPARFAHRPPPTPPHPPCLP